MLRSKSCTVVLASLFFIVGCYPEAPTVAEGHDYRLPDLMQPEIAFEAKAESIVSVEFLCEGSLSEINCAPVIPANPAWAVFGGQGTNVRLTSSLPWQNGQFCESEPEVPCEYDWSGQLLADISLQNLMSATWFGPVDVFFRTQPYVTVGVQGIDTIGYCAGAAGDFGTFDGDTPQYYYEFVPDGGSLQSGQTVGPVEWCFDIVASDYDAFRYRFAVLVSAREPCIDTPCPARAPECIDEVYTTYGAICTATGATTRTCEDEVAAAVDCAAQGLVCDAVAGCVEPEPDPYLVDFEDATKGGYASGTVTLSGLDWNMTEALIGSLADDFKNGVRSARLRGHGTSAMTMLEDNRGGLGFVTFQYRRYGTDAQVDWKVEYSVNEGADWTQIGSAFTAPPTDDVQTFFEYVDVPGQVRLRIKRATETGTSTLRLNIDDILMTNYP